MRRYGLRNLAMIFAASLMLALAGCGTATGAGVVTGAATDEDAIDLSD